MKQIEIGIASLGRFLRTDQFRMPFFKYWMGILVNYPKNKQFYETDT
jgi:hypothetical protein